MAKSGAVWGIDIGQCALKALRCRPHEKDERRLVVEAFDYIEYPKILTQPEADREALVRDALAEFASRNDVTGDRVAIAVPGQSGLARFIKLPPVESKKIPDIVKYEARQQIPFALEDVVWDYQPLIGNMDEGYALETEVGIFAMKRDQVGRALRPLEEAGIEVDIIQLAPLAIYNFVCFDRLNLEAPYDPVNPPPSTVIISLGTDTTDLVITNGYRVWQRNIPIGGNHFTKALTKELKLTFAKAEHLKRNAMKAENPKAVFQAMRPVFSDLVAEIQRSLGFFTSNNRNAKLGNIVALGNPMKLPGLQRYLSQNLDQEVKLVDQFNGLVGGSATASPQYKENQLTFGVAYGLCVQALGESQIRTNLIPEEIITTRLVQAKKPWAVAAVALLLVGITLNYASHYLALTTADTENPAMQQAITATTNLNSQAQQNASQHEEFVNKFNEITEIAHNLQSNVDGRLLWLELLKAVDAARPKDPRSPGERKETAEDISTRTELHFTRMDCEYVADLKVWYDSISNQYVPVKSPEAPPANQPAAGADAAAAAEAAITGEPAASPDAVAGETAPAADPGPSGPGWIIEIQGHHFHNPLPGQPKRDKDEGYYFVLNTFCKNLETKTVKLPDGPNGALIDVPISALGIDYPVIIYDPKIVDISYSPVPADDSKQSGDARRSMGRYPGTFSPGGVDGSDEPPPPLKLRQYDFVLQFAWKPTPRGQRREQAISPATDASSVTTTLRPQ
jgi:type IV pilus assembly protein PilM